MKEIKLDQNSPQIIQETLEESRKVLENGGVIVFPTDTLYGLGANALDENAVLKIYKIKVRSAEKPISVLVRDIAMAKKIACIDSKAEKILERLWPGSITVILRKKDIVPYILTSGEEKVAVRVSDGFFVKELFSRIDFPITATSANMSGEKNLFSAEEIREKFRGSKHAPDLFINAGDLEQGRPSSTIIDLTNIDNPRIVRMGAVGKKELEKFFNNFIN